MEIGRTFLWTENHRNRGPMEFNDPPGYQSREALRIKMSRPLIGTGTMGRRMSYEDLQDAYNIIVGSPETVTEKLRHIRKDFGAGLHPHLRQRGPHAPRRRDALRRTPGHIAKAVSKGTRR